MYNRGNSTQNVNRSPLLPPAGTQQQSKSQIPSLLSTNFQKKPQKRFEITRYDQQSTQSILKTLITSLKRDNNNCVEVLTTDFKHGLYPSTSSTTTIDLSNKCNDKNKDEKLDSVESSHQSQKQPPPSLLSLKLKLPNIFNIHTNLRFDSSGNLLPADPIPKQSDDSVTESDYPVVEPDYPVAESDYQVAESDYQVAESDYQVAESDYQVVESDDPGTNPVISLKDLILSPNRDKRPAKLVLILRGLPGSGKSYLTNLITKEEGKHVPESEGPIVLSIDNYFNTEHVKIENNKKKMISKYKYDVDLDKTYQQSLIKFFKKTIDDNLSNFVIVDMINERVDQIDEMFTYAKSHDFSPFIVELDSELTNLIAARNIHDRSLEDILKIKSAWESLPSSLTKVDFVDFIDYFSQPTDCNINIKVESCSSMDEEHEKEDKRIKTIWDNISPSNKQKNKLSIEDYMNTRTIENDGKKKKI